MSDIYVGEVHIESSTDCNANCKFCLNSTLKRKGMMEFQLFKKIVDESVELGCPVFTPWFINEPLIFPDLWKWMEYFRKKKVKAIIFTNAGNLTDEIGDKLFDYEDIIHSITISFMGITKEIYETNMGLDFNRTTKNIYRFMERRYVLGSTIPVYINTFKDYVTKNAESVFLDLWKGLKFSGISPMNKRHEWAGQNPDENSWIAQQRKAGAINRIACSRIMDQLDVFYDGTVPLCCMDAKGYARFGNVNEMSVKEIMENPLRQYYRDMHNEGRSGELPFCKDCDLAIG